MWDFTKAFISEYLPKICLVEEDDAMEKEEYAEGADGNSEKEAKDDGEDRSKKIEEEEGELCEEEEGEEISNKEGDAPIAEREDETEVEEESKEDEEGKEGKEKEDKAKPEKEEEINMTDMAEVMQGGSEKTIANLGHGGSVSTEIRLGHHMRVTLLTQTSNPSVDGIGGVSSGVGNRLNFRGPNQSRNMSGENNGGGTGLRNGLNNSKGPNLNHLIRINGVQTRPNGTNKNLWHAFNDRESKRSTPGTLATNGGAADRHSATDRWLVAAEMADHWDVDSTCERVVMVRSNEKVRYPGEYEGIKWYKTFTYPSAAKQYIQEQGASIVINADRLAVGKGFTVAMTLEGAYETIDLMLVKGDFGSAGCHVIVEDFLEGEEVSLIAMVDGEHASPLAPVQDHKRVGEGDTGPNPFRMTMGLRGFKIWDPGGSFFTLTVLFLHLEDKVNFEGGVLMGLKGSGPIS